MPPDRGVTRSQVSFPPLVLPPVRMTTDLTKGTGSGTGTDITLPDSFCPQRWHIRTVTGFCTSQGLPDCGPACWRWARGSQDRADHLQGTSAPGTVDRRLLCFLCAVLLTGGSLDTCPVLSLRGFQSRGHFHVVDWGTGATSVTCLLLSLVGEPR